jgi:hypothetical protein
VPRVSACAIDGALPREAFSPPVLVLLLVTLVACGAHVLLVL